MQPASERPFQASRFAYLTNTDGLAASHPGAQQQVENAKSHYTSALKNLESTDKDAREAYHDDKANGLTTDTFGNWAMQNSPEWASAKAEAQAAGAALSSAAMNAFGPAYEQRIREKQSEVDRAAYEAGFQPEIF
ncbi:hypothetical protein BDV38DRAFT_246199 [Aspergillus pseudotamarii]|uniref:Uncharacterized protein n=1 Tax=Aspergillus pseudotamarii TaxID=132259 RepID=A0A5N6SSV4_ASPPS|nr:uncharacterized protein BDV38DRAFT_246199 [Aspergillus pseudotamarii]KAE8137766.1 hypothetical protein BDV38DRAFT_246199 [Aspergillus pseudotamarii]